MLYQVDLVTKHLNIPEIYKRFMYLCELPIGEGKLVYYRSKKKMKGILIQKYKYIGTYGKYDHYTKVDDDESQG